MLDSYFHPYSHSLIGAVLWSGVAGLCYKPFCRGSATATQNQPPWSSAAAVFSHWILDLIRASRDLPFTITLPKLVFGLWNYRDPEFCSGDHVAALGIAVYLARNVNASNSQGAVICFRNRSGSYSDRRYLRASHGSER